MLGPYLMRFQRVGMVKVTSLFIKVKSALGFSFRVRAQTEMKIRCIKGRHSLKVVSSGKNVRV